MKSQMEIENKIHEIEQPCYVTDGEQPAPHHIIGDSFEYGRWRGRIEALTWVLGGECDCCDMSDNSTFAEWHDKMTTEIDDISEYSVGLDDLQPGGVWHD